MAVTKAVNFLKKIYEKLGENDDIEHAEFFNHFIHLLKLPLSKGTSKDRMTQFDEKIFEVVCQFGTSFLKKDGDDEEGENTKNLNESEDGTIELPKFLRNLFEWLLDHHEVESSGARLKVCMLINRLLKLLGEEAEIDDELYDKIHDNMIERLKDKVAEIRAQAVHALQRLQNPKDDQCPIIKVIYEKILRKMLQRLNFFFVKSINRLRIDLTNYFLLLQAFIFHMGCDPSPMVRRAIVRCIGATRVTLPHVLKRTLDVDEKVRKAAYKFIADKVHIKSLTISRREEIVRRGLTDRNENVRNVVAKDLGKRHFFWLDSRQSTKISEICKCQK